MTTQKPPGPRLRWIASKRILGVFSITCTILYVPCWLGEAVHATRENLVHAQSQAESEKPLLKRFQENVQGKIDEIQKVDAQNLGSTFLYDLKMWDCNWRFHCVPSEAAADYFVEELTGADASKYLVAHYELELKLGTAGTGRDFLSLPGSRSPGLPPLSLSTDQNPTEKWNAYQRSLEQRPHFPPGFEFLDPKYIPPPVKTLTPPTPAGSKVKTLDSTGKSSIGSYSFSHSAPPEPSTPRAKQPPPPPSGEPNPLIELNRTLKASLVSLAASVVSEDNTAGNDEPPSRDEFSFAISCAKPRLFVLWPIPTLHTLRGIPRATSVTTKSILAAGPWAITLFLACVILYFGVGAPLILLFFRYRGKKAWKKALLCLIVLISFSPFAVPMMVEAVQLAAAALGGALWGMVSLWIYVAAESAAISVLVGIPHVWKARREVKEAYHVVRHGVEAIEKH